MPLGKGHRLGGQLFRGDCRFFGSLGALLGGFPRPLLILPLQLVLRKILLLSQVNLNSGNVDPLVLQKNMYLSEMLKYGTIIISTLPLMIIYPFVQKYFVKGVMIGSVKG